MGQNPRTTGVTSTQPPDPQRHPSAFEDVFTFPAFVPVPAETGRTTMNVAAAMTVNAMANDLSIEFSFERDPVGAARDDIQISVIRQSTSPPCGENAATSSGRAATAAGARTRGDLLRALAAGTFEGLTGALRFSPDHTRVDPSRIYVIDGEEIRSNASP